MEEAKTSVNFFKDMLPVAILGIVIGLLIRMFLFNITYVSGSSMYPTLSNEDKLIVSNIPKITKDYNRGDIVILDSPSNDNTTFIKRIIGVEGDIVSIKEGKVYLNGEELNEDYIEEGVDTGTYSEDRWEVPSGNVLVIGDNRLDGASLDGRFFGSIPVDSLNGIAKFRFLPLGSAKRL